MTWYMAFLFGAMTGVATVWPRTRIVIVVILMTLILSTLVKIEHTLRRSDPTYICTPKQAEEGECLPLRR